MSTSGNDTILAGFLVTNIDGGSGTDILTLDYSGDFGGEAAGEVYLRLFDQSDSAPSFERVYNAAGAEIATFQVFNFEQYNVTGSAGDDSIFGDNQSDTIFGGDGNDYIHGPWCMEPVKRNPAFHPVSLNSL